MNILIINAHSSKNKGDAGIILSMVDAIKKHNPESDIKILSRFPQIDGEFYDEAVEECIDNVSIDPKTSKIKKLASSLKLLATLFNIRKVNSQHYHWADVVVSCGGGFLLSHRFSVALMQHLVQIKTAIDQNKPVIIYSQSIGPFYNGLMQRLSKKVLNKVNKIYIRESVSDTWLEKIGCSNTNIELVPDSAFSMQSEASEKIDDLFSEIKEMHSGPIIGMTVRDWNFPEVDAPEYHRQKYIDSVRNAIEHLRSKYNAKVLLMPQVLGPNSFNDDRIISREVLKDIDSTKAELLDYDLHPKELKYLYSKMDMFVGTRMHSNIFALSSIVPTVAINYEHKTRGIMEMLNLNEYVVDIKDIEPEAFTIMLDHCWSNKDHIINHLENEIPQVVSNAEIPAKILKNL
jgi:colanic acid/amylovoran biosynthesis protein